MLIYVEDDPPETGHDEEGVIWRYEGDGIWGRTARRLQEGLPGYMSHALEQARAERGELCHVETEEP